MSIDLTGVTVAVIGIVGTLGASVLTQRAASRDRQIEATNQRNDRAEERHESARAAADAQKRIIYADLNAAVRDYRSVGHDYLVDKMRGAEPDDFQQLEKARAHYREVYAQAQMVLPDDVLKVARAVNNYFGHSYRALHDINNGFDRSITIEQLHRWYEGLLLEAVDLLRHVLREELGITKTSVDIDHSLSRLRETQLHLWPGESEAVIDAPAQAETQADDLSVTE